MKNNQNKRKDLHIRLSEDDFEKINKNPDLTQLELVDAERLKTILEILKSLF